MVTTPSRVEEIETTLSQEGASFVPNRCTTGSVVATCRRLVAATAHR
jgi:hypothetical protein